MIKKNILISVMIVVVLLSYTVFCVINLNGQKNVKYMRRSDVLDVLAQNREYFDSLAEYYKAHKNCSIFYDLTNQSFVSQVGEEEAGILSELFQKHSFNMIQREDDYLSILYNRPFDHLVVIGMFYDYDEEKWTFTYAHNYERCATGHFNGYFFYDLIFN